MFILTLFCKATCLLRPICIENFSGRSKQVLLYRIVTIFSQDTWHLLHKKSGLFLTTGTFLKPCFNLNCQRNMVSKLTFQSVIVNLSQVLQVPLRQVHTERTPPTRTAVCAPQNLVTMTDVRLGSLTISSGSPTV